MTEAEHVVGKVVQGLIPSSFDCEASLTAGALRVTAIRNREAGKAAMNGMKFVEEAFDLRPATHVKRCSALGFLAFIQRLEVHGN
jgi:hypothetical protein